MGKIDVRGVPECTKCGVCCFSHAPDYLRVFGLDHDRLGADAERLTRSSANQLYMRIEDGHCVALTYHAASQQFLCSIYERRPDVCRALERGSGHCAADRAEKSDRPLVMLRKSRDAAS